ncbi:hypothetical protein GCM10022232_45530 [Streptomyces plumbiresistens]|uniref:Uncharacterized protein n=1 Tax=Streptomyces plumbiresistens TaxID=511811 RepID=A0ABP7RT56_9ACTN
MILWGDVVSFVAVTLAAADSPGEHLQLAAFTAAAAVVFIWMGRRQRRTGRSLIAPNETMRTADRLVSPPPPSRGYRTAGCAWIGFGSLFILPAVFNVVAAIRGLIG